LDPKVIGPLPDDPLLLDELSLLQAASAAGPRVAAAPRPARPLSAVRRLKLGIELTDPDRSGIACLLGWEASRGLPRGG
jgi:hypothetical protein